MEKVITVCPAVCWHDGEHFMLVEVDEVETED